MAPQCAIKKCRKPARRNKKGNYCWDHYHSDGWLPCDGAGDDCPVHRDPIVVRPRSNQREPVMTEEQKLITEMRQKLEQQKAIIDRLTEVPQRVGVVLRSREDSTMLALGSEIVHSKAKLPKDLAPGTFFSVPPETGGIGDEIEPMALGSVQAVTKVLPDGFLEIGEDFSSSVILASPRMGKVKVGDRVVCDRGNFIAVKNLGPATKGYSVPEDEISITWADVGGLEEAKQQLREAIELPVKNPELFKKYKQAPMKGVLLYGPPGVGKTLLAKASVNALAKLHGKEAMGSGFIYVKGPEILSKFVGESEATIRGLFHRAREHFERHAFPAIIFIDEADAILGRRGMGISSDIDRTIVPQFLSEMDGLESKGAPIMLLSTNRPDSLDPAVVRDGRIDRKIEITRPKPKDALAIFKIHLKGRPVAESGLPEHATTEFFCDTKVVAKVSCTDGSTHNLNLAHIINGAMIAGTVNRATSLAMQRELDGGKAAGLCKDDLSQAIKEATHQAKRLDLDDDVKALVQGREVVQIAA